MKFRFPRVRGWGWTSAKMLSRTTRSDGLIRQAGRTLRLARRRTPRMFAEVLVRVPARRGSAFESGGAPGASRGSDVTTKRAPCRQRRPPSMCLVVRGGHDRVNALVLLCYKSNEQQKGQQRSSRSRARAIRMRSVAMDCGLCRSARERRAAGLELGRNPRRA